MSSQPTIIIKKIMLGFRAISIDGDLLMLVAAVMGLSPSFNIDFLLLL
ncbi:MAG: hypothetical protein ACM31H_03875 [Nitrososphaerales archaeon]